MKFERNEKENDMKTTNQDKATARPFESTIHNLRCGQSVAGVAARPYLESVEIDLNLRAAEQAELLKVAENHQTVMQVLIQADKEGRFLSFQQVKQLVDAFTPV
ncbi:MAG: hypothetical protein KGL39_10095 [Patescibacteria group bacterium]|nr:hypothetical protein [Patescibacteria group bacterium]